MPKHSARTILRRETRDLHDRVDALFSSLDLTIVDGYGRFLTAQATAFLPCEEALDAAGAADLIADWNSRRRSAALEQDLAALSLTPPEPIGAPDFPSTAAILGGVYVLEGSRLGGAMLARSVPADLPKHFLSAGSGGSWRGFIHLLDEAVISEEQIRDALEAARKVFSMFERGARAELETI